MVAKLQSVFQVRSSLEPLRSWAFNSARSPRSKLYIEEQTKLLSKAWLYALGEYSARSDLGLVRGRPSTCSELARHITKSRQAHIYNLDLFLKSGVAAMQCFRSPYEPGSNAETLGRRDLLTNTANEPGFLDQSDLAKCVWMS